MPTIVDALTAATDALNNAVQNVLAVRAQIAAQLAAATTASTTVINNFLARPQSTNFFVDANNGIDTNDGLTITTPKKTVDAVLGGLTPAQNAVILLLSDVTLLNYNQVGGTLSCLGIQQAANASGFIIIPRAITFLGTAQNSPIPLPGGTLASVPSGISIGGGAFGSNNVNFNLPDQPAGQNSGHLQSNAGASFSLVNGTISASGSAAGYLIEVDVAKSNVFLQMALSGASGHLFKGVAAGTNPNSLYQYSSNVTSG